MTTAQLLSESSCPTPVAKQDAELHGEILSELARTVQNGHFVLGSAVDRFERSFADYCGASHCVGTNSGTSAIHLALRCLDIGPGDEVITTPTTFIGTVWPILYVGATPRFVDIDPETRMLDPDQLEAAITECTKAIIVVHLHGIPGPVRQIAEIARRHAIHVVEDACQAHAARVDGRHVGTIGRVGCFSFYPGKNLGAYGDAGCLITDDKRIAHRATSLRDHAQSTPHRHDELGFNYRLDAMQAVILSIKLRMLDRWTDRRRSMAAMYDELLHDAAREELISLPADHRENEGVYHQYVVEVGERDRVRSELQHQGVWTGLHYPLPLHLQPALAPLGYRRGSFPNAERNATRCLSLPIGPGWCDADIQRAARSLLNALPRRQLKAV